MASSLTSIISSGVISGSGFAQAKIIGFLAIVFTNSFFKAPLADNPKNTSAPFIASSKVLFLVSTAWADFHWSIPSVLPL